MSKEIFKQAAAKLFASSTHNVLWANIENPKQEFFTSENLGLLSLKSGEKLTKFERPEEKKTIEATTSEKKELNANAAIAFIKMATSLEAIKLLETDERKSVKEAYDKKVIELTAAIQVTGAKTETGATDGAAGTGNGNEDTATQK